VDAAEPKMDQWVMDHGSNGSTNLDGSRESWVTCDPFIDNDVTGVPCNNHNS